MTYLYPPTAEQERLLAIMYNNPDVPREPKKKVLERAEAGRMLAALGDPRAEVMTVDGMHFCAIPAGIFQLGSDRDKLGFKNERPATLYEIPYEYWMARYPVTQAQFQAFVDDNGYLDERWWGVAQAAGCWSAAGYQSLGSYTEHYDDAAPRVAPLPYEEPFSLPNHPVVGVSWYEGVAFATWLTARWRTQGFLTEAQQVVVPSEPEWKRRHAVAPSYRKRRKFTRHTMALLPLPRRSPKICGAGRTPTATWQCPSKAITTKRILRRLMPWVFLVRVGVCMDARRCVAGCGNERAVAVLLWEAVRSILTTLIVSPTLLPIAFACCGVVPSTTRTARCVVRIGLGSFPAIGPSPRGCGWRLPL